MLHFMGIDTLQLNPFCSWGKKKTTSKQCDRENMEMVPEKGNKNIKELGCSPEESPSRGTAGLI